MVLYTLWRAHKDGGRNYLLERFGVYSPPRNPTTANTEVIWIHAASVGEVFTVLPLLKALSIPLLVTTTTPTGAAVLAQQRLAHVEHCYLPVDFAGACKRFFKNHAIREGWIVETEIWPWLYACARKNATDLTIISGRLSPKTSSQARGFLATTFRRALNDVRVLARSDKDASRFVALGALPSMTTVAGNLKYANSAVGSSIDHLPKLINHPYVLAASTHDNEEQQLAVAWCQQSANVEPNALLVIVPRHTERGEAIQKQLAALGIYAPLRSKSEALQNNNRVYIADTLGEMQAWYKHAIACFVGGSLIERGGHNILEPARLGCPVVVGPHTANFVDIVDSFSKHDALVIAQQVDQVVQFLHDAIVNPKALEPMIQRARMQAEQSEGVLSIYLEALMGAPEISPLMITSADEIQACDNSA